MMNEFSIDNKITAIIPARGGSKGLHRKNLLMLGKNNLTRRAVKFALNASEVSRVILSSDDDEILNSVSDLQTVEQHKRPDNLATDKAKAVEVVLKLVEEYSINSEFILLLQPTTPLRRLSDLTALITLIQTNNAEACVSVVAHEEPRPEKLQRIANGLLHPYLGEKFEGPRQSLPLPYALNGGFYLIKTTTFLKEKSFLPEKTAAYIMPPEQSINIDTPLDWKILTAMIKQGFWSYEEY